MNSSEKKEDLRTIKTRKAILKAFHKLALEKDLKDISVTALTEEAEINRKTFYLHYHSIEDLIDELQVEFFDNIFEHVGAAIMESKDGEEAFRRSLLFLAEDPEWSYLICSRYDYGRIWDAVNDINRRPWNFEEFLPNKKYTVYISAYMIENLRTIFCLWYRSGMKISPAKMADLGTYAIFHGTNTLDSVDINRL